MRSCVLSALFATCGLGQSFEVASVRLAGPDKPFGNLYQGGPGTPDPARFTATNASLLGVVERAFGIQEDQLTAPDWSLMVRIDIAAVVPAGATPKQFSLMLQHLLAERFHMTYHTGRKEVPAYKMTIARGGPKLKPSTGEVTGPVTTGLNACAGDRLVSHHRTAADLATLLHGVAGARVIDETGLTGTYDIELYYGVDRSLSNGPMRCKDVPVDAPPPLQAIEKQLGLKLEKTRMTLDVIVIDRLDRTPSDD